MRGFYGRGGILLGRKSISFGLGGSGELIVVAAVCLQGNVHVNATDAGAVLVDATAEGFALGNASDAGGVLPNAIEGGDVLTNVATSGAAIKCC